MDRVTICWQEVEQWFSQFNWTRWRYVDYRLVDSWIVIEVDNFDLKRNLTVVYLNFLITLLVCPFKLSKNRTHKQRSQKEVGGPIFCNHPGWVRHERPRTSIISCYRFFFLKSEKSVKIEAHKIFVRARGHSREKLHSFSSSPINPFCKNHPLDRPSLRLNTLKNCGGTVRSATSKGY